MQHRTKKRVGLRPLTDVDGTEYLAKKKLGPFPDKTPAPDRKSVV